MIFYKQKWFKILGSFFLAIFILVAFFSLRFKPAEKIEWGLSFSESYVEYLGFDWKKTYLEVLDDLKPKKVRIMAYWEKLEPKQGEYDFQNVDFMLSEAQKRGVQILLVVGHKQPRWPECHHPAWYENLSQKEQDQAVLVMLSEVVRHFQKFSNIAYWQLENEPFFNYGPNCDPLGKELFKKELDVIKSLDPRPVVVTDSGEKGAWLPLAWAGGDIFGSTMYREAYYEKKGRYIKYPLPPAFYRVRAGMIRALTSINEILGVELQAEPWFVQEIYHTSLEKQLQIMDLNKLNANINYAEKVGFKENYLWGTEWWYYMKQNNHPEFWERIKQLNQ